MSDLVSNLQSMRDRMMDELPKRYGDQFDGDFDVMLEAINALKRSFDSEKDAERFRWLGRHCVRVQSLRIDGNHDFVPSVHWWGDMRGPTFDFAVDNAMKAQREYQNRAEAITGTGDG